jgi:3-dehydroshikimate dehydratase|tara:strand:- start:2813 stop:3604 length:792 start_codon:yes stop_codon:yes gene_type:complete
MNTLLKPGLVSISFRELSLEEIVELVAETGLTGVEWGGDVHVPHGDLVTAERTRLLTRDAGLQVSAYGSYYRFDECYENVNDEGPEFGAVLDSAEVMGAPSIRVWAGRQNSADVSDGDRGRVIEQARKMGEEAAKRNIRIDFEFHDHSLTDTNEATGRLLDEIGHSNVGTFWQTKLLVGHAYRLEGLKALVDRVTNIHCNFFGEDEWPNAHLISDGKQDWADYFSVLTQSGLERWITIEHVKNNAVESFRRDAETLKQWIARG